MTFFQYYMEKCVVVFYYYHVPLNFWCFEKHCGAQKKMDNIEHFINPKSCDIYKLSFNSGT